MKLHIEDLRTPVLPDSLRKVMASAEARRPTLTVQAVLDAAAGATGLTDFGARDFEERLALWLAEVDDDPNRTALSAATIFHSCLKYARNRLRVIDLLDSRPEIHDQEITAPIIVTGLPRSGTTALVNLIAADSRFRSLPLWESDEPVPVIGDGPGRDGVDPRFQRAAKAWAAMQRGNPFLAAWHPMDPRHIHEELELMCLDFASYQPEWILQVAPGWRDHEAGRDQTSHFEWLRTMLKVLQWHRGPQRWVLKCPQHLENLEPLMSVFPDATVVMTHRDPVASVQSAATMQAYSARTSFHELDVDAIFTYWADRMEGLLRAGLAGRHLVPAAQIVDVPFARLNESPMSVLDDIYSAGGLELTEPARTEIEAHRAENPRDSNGVLEYDLRRDFGITAEELRERFAFYLVHHPSQPEV